MITVAQGQRQYDNSIVYDHAETGASFNDVDRSVWPTLDAFLRIDSPLSAMRCAACTMRSRMASAKVGSFSHACQPVDRQLAGDQRGAGADAVVEQFEQVVAFGRRDRRDGEVVDAQQVDARELRQAAAEAAVAVGDAQFLEQPRRAHVQHREAGARGLLRQRAGQPGLADAGGAGDQDVVAVAQPVAAGQCA